MKISSKGVTRIVFIFSRFVIKIPKPYKWSHFLRGILGNINEGNTWKWNTGKYEKGTSHLLCPVIWRSVGGWVLIMKRAETFTRKPDMSVDEHIKHFPGDDTISNYGLLDGRLVKIDYAELDVATSVFNSRQSR